MMLQPIAPEDIGPHWAWVRDGLKHAAARAPAHYQPEDIYVLLQGRAAQLFVVEQKGFLVLQTVRDPDGTVLHVFAIWCNPGEFEPIKEQLYADLLELARGFKAKRIRIQSPRKWDAEPFWKAVAAIYEHEVI